jgi:hypothetical protein
VKDDCPLLRAVSAQPPFNFEEVLLRVLPSGFTARRATGSALATAGGADSQRTSLGPLSERTLQYAFKEVMGLTPVAYLTRLRLHRVRHALRTATQAWTTVTAEALRWGFWHFGDFSRAYKDCFGELPSDTLRRKPRAAPEPGSRDGEV